MDIQNKIDWKFIGELEGDSIYGSVPTENSGVTIGMGFDLKEKDTNFLSVKMGLSDSLVEKAGASTYFCSAVIPPKPV